MPSIRAFDIHGQIVGVFDYTGVGTDFRSIDWIEDNMFVVGDRIVTGRYLYETVRLRWQDFPVGVHAGYVVPVSSYFFQTPGVITLYDSCVTYNKKNFIIWAQKTGASAFTQLTEIDKQFKVDNNALRIFNPFTDLSGATSCTTDHNDFFFLNGTSLSGWIRTVHITTNGAYMTRSINNPRVGTEKGITFNGKEFVIYRGDGNGVLEFIDRNGKILLALSLAAGGGGGNDVCFNGKYYFVTYP